MTKAQILTKKDKKEPNMGLKEGSVAKKKSQKFKVTPTNKVALIKKKQKNYSNADGSLQLISKNKNKPSSNKAKLKIKTDKIESNDEDFNLKNDNESLEDSDESIKDNIKNKGVKMFKGLKTVENDSDINENEDNSEIDEKIDDSNDDEAEDCGASLKTLLGDTIVDDDDDEDFNEDNESDEDEDISDDDEETFFNDSKQNIGDSESEDEDNEGLGLKALLDETLVDEEDDDDFKGDLNEEEEDDDISDESDENREKIENIEESNTFKKIFTDKQEKNSNEKEQDDIDARTIFVGNVPNNTSVKIINQLFRSCGEIESVRIRGVVPEDNKMSFKVATITKKMHPKVNSMYAFIVFKDEVSVKEALKLNGHKLGNNTLRVDLSNFKNKIRDKKKSVFIGNLPFDITEDEVRAHFTSCGNIESVRIVRDRKSGLSRGIGYVNFVDEDSVSLALELNDTLMKKSKLRVKIYCPNPKGKKRKYGVNKQQNDFKKKFKNNKGKDIIAQIPEKKGNKQNRSQGEIKREKINKRQNPTSEKIENMNISFQGTKADVKKKVKINKMDKKKKLMSEKLTSVKISAKMTN